MFGAQSEAVAGPRFLAAWRCCAATVRLNIEAMTRLTTRSCFIAGEYEDMPDKESETVVKQWIMWNTDQRGLADKLTGREFK